MEYQNKTWYVCNPIRPVTSVNVFTPSSLCGYKWNTQKYARANLGALPPPPYLPSLYPHLSFLLLRGHCSPTAVPSTSSTEPSIEKESTVVRAVTDQIKLQRGSVHYYTLVLFRAKNVLRFVQFPLALTFLFSNERCSTYRKL